jgi:dihydropteroate synthase
MATGTVKLHRVLKTKPENALNGPTAVNTIALLNGANILRVHDVREAVQCVKIVEQYKVPGF